MLLEVALEHREKAMWRLAGSQQCFSFWSIVCFCAPNNIADRWTKQTGYYFHAVVNLIKQTDYKLRTCLMSGAVKFYVASLCSGAFSLWSLDKRKTKRRKITINCNKWLKSLIHWLSSPTSLIYPPMPIQLAESAEQLLIKSKPKKSQQCPTHHKNYRWCQETKSVTNPAKFQKQIKFL